MPGMKRFLMMLFVGVIAVAECAAQQTRFHLQEATIADVHRAIQTGQITCRGLVEAYLNRAKAYNGVSNRIVTEQMGSELLPNYKDYKAAVAATAELPPNDPRKTLPIEFGRMEPTASDPDVQQQYGMTIGIPNAGQLNAIATLNIRGQRSVTCKGDRDKKSGRPFDAPAVCAEFAEQPDALEQAAALDAKYGRNPDLVNLPMYCIPFTFKDSFDTKDMRSTTGADARYDIDFPARDHTLVAQLRKKGAIIYAKANSTEYNGRGPGDPGGKNHPNMVLPSTLGYQRSSWAGNPSNPYDTTRAASLGSSSGSGVTVGANLTMCSVCEETGRSCRGPANHNSVALILPHKSMISFLGGAIGAEIYNDRSGIHCRTIGDAAKVLDALKDPVMGYYDSRDIFTTVPRSSYPAEPISKALHDGRPGALKGMRIGIVREFMVKHAKADEPIVDAASAEIKNILGKQLGATLVESVTPGWPDDPDIENMSPTFDQAIAQIVPVLYPELLFQVTRSGEPKFPEFAARIEPTPFENGKPMGTGTLTPAEWMLRWSEGLEANPPDLNLRSLLAGMGVSRTFRFHVEQYLMRRSKDWADRGFTETLKDWPTLNARSKVWGDDARAMYKNWEEIRDLRNPAGSPQGIAERIQLREVLRRVIVKVIQENKLDVMINVHSTLVPGKIGLAPEPVVKDRDVSFPLGPNAGITEILIPAGYVRVAYDPAFVLATDQNGRKSYRSKTGTTPTPIPAPGLPFSISFWAEPGMEPLILKAASAYEAASRRRVPPPAFPPLVGEP